MLLGREAELARIHALLEQGGPLVLRGHPGIGKTALLDAARTMAGATTVLEARGIESESTLPFAALRDLLGPVIEAADALPHPQWAALAGALALGPPAPGDRLTVCVATLAILEAAAPLVVLVDDLQWLDEPSRECVLYAAHRAGPSLAFVMTERDDAEVHDLPVTCVGPLDEVTATALLMEVAPDLDGEVRTAVCEAAAGNPLALVELPATLTSEQRLGRERVDQPLAPRNGLQRVFTERVAALPDRTSQALLVAAASRSDELAPILAACRELGLGVEDLHAAEAAGLITLGVERIAFSHPLVRGGAYHSAPAHARRTAHRTLATVIQDESRAWHLAAAAVGPDEDAARALEQAAGVAASRRAYGVAADALERAGRLTGSEGAAAPRLAGAAAAALSAGRAEQASALADEAFERANDPATRAAAGHLRGMLAMWGGRVTAARTLLERSAEDAGSIPGMAALILGDASFACSAAGDCRQALALAERAAALLPDDADPMVRAPVLAILAWSLVMRGQAERSRPIYEEVAALMPAIDPVSPAAQLILTAVNARLPFEDYEGALAESLELVERAREAGSLYALPTALVIVGITRYLLGDWEGVEEPFADGIAAAEETGQWGPAALGRSVRARVVAAKGDEAECRADAEAVLALAEAADAHCFAVYGHFALGHLALGAGRVDEAVEELEETARLAAVSALEEPILIPWAPDLVEAYVRAGREDAAAEMLAVLERQAAGADTHAAAALAARCRGLVAADGFDAHFEEAMRLHARSTMPFERARTLLAWGMRLHRARRRVDARERLREAAAALTELGATPWAVLATAELRAAGGRRREGVGDALTAQEERVARAAARGATTREVAAELFLSPKTVEFHLGHIYKKLGVRSRAALATALAEQVSASEPGSARTSARTGGPSDPAP